MRFTYAVLIWTLVFFSTASAQTVQQAVERLNTSDFDSAVAALGELTSLPEEDALPALARAMETLPTGNAKLALFIFNDKLVPYLVENLHAGRPDSLRQRSSWALTVLGPESTFPVLSRLLVDPKIGSFVSQIIDYQHSVGFQSVFDQMLKKEPSKELPQYTFQNTHAGGLKDLYISPGGDWLISLGEDQRIKFRNLSTRKVEWEKLAPYQASSIAVLETKNVVLVSGWGEIYKLDIQTGKRLASIHTNAPVRLGEISKDQNYVLGSGGNGVNFIDLIDVRNNEYSRLLEVAWEDERFPGLQGGQISWFQEFVDSPSPTIRFGNRADLEWPNARSLYWELNAETGIFSGPVEPESDDPTTLRSEGNKCSANIRDQTIEIASQTSRKKHNIEGFRVNRWKYYNGYIIVRLVAETAHETRDGTMWGFPCDGSDPRKFNTSTDYFSFSEVYPFPDKNLLIVHEDRKLNFRSFFSEHQIRSLSSELRVPTAIAVNKSNSKIFIGYSTGSTVVEFDLTTGAPVGELQVIGQGVGDLSYQSVQGKNLMYVTTMSGSFEVWEKLQRRNSWRLVSIFDGIEQRPQKQRVETVGDTILLRGDLQRVRVLPYEIATPSKLATWRRKYRKDNTREVNFPQGLGRHFLEWGSRVPFNLLRTAGEHAKTIQLPAEYDLTTFGFERDGLFLGGAGWFGKMSENKSEFDWVLGSIPDPDSYGAIGNPSSFTVNFEEESYYDFILPATESEICVSGSRGTLGCYDKDSGRELWSVRYQHALMGNLFSFDGLAYLPSENSLITTGSDGRLRKWDRETGQLLSISEASGFELTDVANMGHLLVALSTGGEVSFWKPSDLTKIASFVYSNRKEWVTYSTEGYFHASENGGNLVALSYQGESVTLSDFSGILLDPDHVAKTLKDAHCCVATELINVFLQPRAGLTVLKISEGFAELLVETNRHTHGFQVNLNGRTVAQHEEHEKTTRISIELDTGLNRIDVSALSESGISAPPKTIFLTANDAPDAVKYLGIALSSYPDAPLANPVNDVELIGKSIRAVIPNVKPNYLMDGDVSIESIEEQIQLISETSDSSSMLIAMIAGHGSLTSKLGPGLNLTNGGLIPFEAITEAFSVFPGQVFLLLDTCHAGSAALGEFTSAAGIEVSEAFSAPDSNVHLLLSSRSFEFALDGLAGSSNSPFAEAVALALTLQADTNPRDGVITIGEISTLVSEDVFKKSGGLQLPYNPLLDRSLRLPVVEF